MTVMTRSVSHTPAVCDTCAASSRGPGSARRRPRLVNLTLQVGERVDDRRGFEGAVPSAHGDLGQEPGGYQALDSRVGLRIAAGDKRSGSAHGEDGGSGDRPDQ